MPAASLISEIRREVREIASNRGMQENEAFGYWYLEKYEDLSQEDAENTIIDGPWDRGRDAIYLDEENQKLKIYQFKYSENISYVRQALTDLQRGIIEERERLKNVEAVDLIIVTIASLDDQLYNEKEKVEKRIREWINRQGYKIDLRLEVIDIKKFLEYSKRFYGVHVTLAWNPKYIIKEKIKGEERRAIIGRLNATGLKKVINKEELFSFNIRKFLGIRRGSVGYKMIETLRNEQKRKYFWILNNGIVCLCTKFQEKKDDKVEFENFTIVNGAQTINVIIRFLNENPTVNEPIWVVAKVLEIPETEVEWARDITAASNTQTPTSTRDLKAIDIWHR